MKTKEKIVHSKYVEKYINLQNQIKSLNSELKMIKGTLALRMDSEQVNTIYTTDNSACIEKINRIDYKPDKKQLYKVLKFSAFLDCISISTTKVRKYIGNDKLVMISDTNISDRFIVKEL